MEWGGFGRPIFVCGVGALLADATRCGLTMLPRSGVRVAGRLSEHRDILPQYADLYLPDGGTH